MDHLDLRKKYKYRKHFEIPDDLNHLFNGYTPETYLQLLKDIIVGNEDPQEVVLLEVEPYKQNTKIDFHATRKMLGISVVCVTDVMKRGNKLFYKRKRPDNIRFL